MNSSDQKKTPKHSDIGKMAKGSVLVGAGDLLGNLFFYVNSVIITRTIGADLYGLFFLGNIIALIGSMIARLGLDYSILRFVALFKGRNQRERIFKTVNSGLVISILAGIIVVLIIGVLAPYLAKSVFRKPQLVSVIILLAAGIPFTNIIAMLVNLFLGLNQVKFKVLIENIMLPLIKLLLIILLFKSGMQLRGVVYATIGSAFLVAVYGLFFTTRRFPQIRNSGFENNKKLMSFSLPILGESILNYIISWIDILILGYYASSAEVGILGIVYRISIVLVFVQYSFNAIFSPMISELYGTNRLCRLEQLFKLQTRWAFSFTLPLLILIILFPSHIMQVFGNSFVDGALALVIISIGRFSDTVVGASGLMIMMIGKPKINTINSLIILIIKIILNIILIPKFGLLGAAFAGAVSILLMDIMRVCEVYYILKIHPYSIKFIKPLIAAAASFAVISLVTNKSGSISTTIPELILYAALFLGSYFSVLYFLKLDEQDEFVLKSFYSKFMARFNN
ncbi:oligosaccharide flippase family protein [candidate division KSB1 bacterium]|nr:oligosaccharide flippase family protein [candidate division KSB1 bacterium]